MQRHKRGHVYHPSGRKPLKNPGRRCASQAVSAPISVVMENGSGRVGEMLQVQLVAFCFCHSPPWRVLGRLPGYPGSGDGDGNVFPPRHENTTGLSHGTYLISRPQGLM